jgi:hypothetical protein
MMVFVPALAGVETTLLGVSASVSPTISDADTNIVNVTDDVPEYSYGGRAPVSRFQTGFINAMVLDDADVVGA